MSRLTFIDKALYNEMQQFNTLISKAVAKLTDLEIDEEVEDEILEALEYFDGILDDLEFKVVMNG